MRRVIHCRNFHGRPASTDSQLIRHHDGWGGHRRGRVGPAWRANPTRPPHPPRPRHRRLRGLLGREPAIRRTRTAGRAGRGGGFDSRSALSERRERAEVSQGRGPHRLPCHHNQSRVMPADLCRRRKRPTVPPAPPFPHPPTFCAPPSLPPPLTPTPPLFVFFPSMPHRVRLVRSHMTQFAHPPPPILPIRHAPRAPCA